jgi:membrane-bound lytic murein transglycosylase D
MWQFMRGTGRRFLRIDNTVDERLDPYRATEAAGRFLEQNYIVLGSWPLALTAYNHGTAGMRRAKEQLGTDDIAVIVRKYSSRSFGFASRNFYVAFLAALDIDSNPEKYFGALRRNPVDTSHLLPLPNFMPAGSLAALLDIDRDELRRLNPSLLPAVWSGSRYIPKGFNLRVPSTIDLTAALNKINAGGIAVAAQVAETHHRVSRGDTLSGIASRYGISIGALADANNLRRPYRIRAGQLLTLPGKAPPPIVVAQIEKPAPKAAPPTGVVESEGSIVKRGDTLSRIAARHGMTEEQLMALNDIRNRNFVYEGQVLALAASERTAPPVEAAVPVESPAPPPAEAVTVAEAEEPVSEREAEAEGPSLVPGSEAAASADPSDYSVRRDDTIEVQATETLGHYAEWLNMRASQLRRINRMSFATPVVIGHRLKMDFSKVTRDQFEAQRTEYHRQLQEAFFAQYRIKGDETHVVKSGESVWALAQQRYNVPLWLLRQYNPDVDLGTVRPGTRLVIPLVEATAAADAGN